MAGHGLVFFLDGKNDEISKGIQSFECNSPLLTILKLSLLQYCSNKSIILCKVNIVLFKHSAAGKLA